MNILKNLKFWKKFSYFLLIGIASLFILAGGQEIVINSAQLARAENPIPIPPPPPPPACTETPRDFPQCGGTAGLEGRDPTHTFIVREFTNSCTQAKRFEVVEDKGNLGQCQVAPPPPACTETPRDFPQCGGTAGLEGRDPTHTFIVREFTNSCTQAKRFEVV